MFYLFLSIININEYFIYILRKDREWSYGFLDFIKCWIFLFRGKISFKIFFKNR